ncbi:MAG: TSUP family transporter, partial [Parasphingorhabdus sp.]
MDFAILGLAIVFALAAALYASVGFGGGSTYIALLALSALDYRALPIIALLCNIIVVSGGTLRFQSRGLIDWRRILPILLLSVPAAWLGGRLVVAEGSFMILLGLSLAAAAILLMIEPFIKRAGDITGNG